MDKMPKPSLFLLALMGALAAVPLQALRSELTGLAQGTDPATPVFTSPESVAAGTTVRIDGSSSMTVLNQTLAQEFEQRYPNTEVTLADRGDEEALRALQAGQVDLAALGRSLSDSEKAQTLTEVPITREKIAVIVGRDNPFQGDLSFGDFARIFRGEITNWAEVGGPDAPLRFIDRPVESDVRRALSEYEVFQQQPFEASPTTVTVVEDNTAAVVRELGTHGISYAIATEVLNQDAVRPVSMHSTLPSDPRYPYSQPRNYVFQGEASLPVEVFLGFATNAAGQVAVATAQATESANVTVGATQPPGGVTVSPDGQFMVRGNEDGSLEWLDDQGQSTATVIPEAHRGAVSAIVISPNGQTVVSSGADGTLRRWDRTGNPLGEPITGSDSPILTLALSPDGQTLVSGNADGTVGRWALADGTAVGEPIAAHAAPIQAISYPAGGQNFITGSSDGSLAVWTADGTPAGRVEAAHQGGVTAIVSSPDGQVFTTTGEDGTVQPWERATLQRRGETIAAHTGRVNAATYSPDGNTLATAGADSTLQLWGGDNTARLPEPIALDAPASSLGFTPAGQLIVGTADNQVELRSAEGERLTSPSPAESTPGPLMGNWLSHVQNMPQNTWWILAAIPALLILLGLLGALFGRKRKVQDDDDLLPITEPNSSLGIDFSELGQAPPELEENAGVTDLPPESDLIVVEGGGIDPSSASKLEQARVDLAEGKRLLQAERYEAALICFNSAIEATEVERLKAETLGTPLGGINALATQAQAQRGHALARMEQAGEAMESYNTALSLDGSAVEAWIGKGRLLLDMGRAEEALFCFDSALEMDESLGAAWAGKGQALMALGRQTEGQTCLNRAAVLGTQGSGSFYLAGELGDAGDGGMNADGDLNSLDPLPLEDYDPDVPLELQQVVMGLPSADTDLAYALPTDYDGVPPELATAIAQLPDQPEYAPDYAPEYAPEYALADGTTDNPDGAEYDRPAFDPAYPSPSGLAITPPPTLEDELIAQIDLAPTVDWDAARPTPPSPVAPGAIMTPAVPLKPGDFIPPPPEPALASVDLDDLPPEVLAALASIPAGSPDSFDLPAADPPAPPLGDTPLSWVKLTLDQDHTHRFYAVWHVDNGDRAQAKAQGGETLAVRLYDVTGHATQVPLPAPVEEQRCHDDFAQDWYLPIPQRDRIYLAEIGYLSATGEWWAIARSSEVPAITP